jgi:hypothetical protein
MTLFGLPISVSLPNLSYFSIYNACNINGLGCYSSLVDLYATEYSGLIYLPVGIADYGIALINDKVYQYSYNTDEVVGFVYLKYFDTKPEPGPLCTSEYENAGTVQLNGVVAINSNYGRTYYLWAQNVLDFNNEDLSYEFVNNIWDANKYDNVLENYPVYGRGIIKTYFSFPHTTKFYVYSTDSYDLIYPIAVYLIMKVYINNNSYPVIQFGYSLDGNNTIWYDNVTVEVPSVSAYFQVSPSYTPDYTVKNLELVIGGPGNSECIYADKIDGYLALLYNNNGNLSTAPYVFNYGLNTAEESTNINPLLVSSTEAYLSTGYFYPGYLGSKNISYYTVTIYNPITKEYETETSPIILYKVYNFTPIITVPGGYYKLMGIYVNNILHPSSSIPLLIDKNYTINLNYKLYYFVDLTIPGGKYFVNNKQYIGENTITVENGTTLTIYLNKYYYYNNLRYECPGQVNITVSGPENIQLLNYCIPEYYVQINSKLPINITIGSITITNITSYSDYIPVNQTIYIHKSVIIKDRFFYYNIYTIDPENITVNQPIQISLYPTKTIKLNYITITGTVSGILVSIPTSIIFIKKRRKKKKKLNKQ